MNKIDITAWEEFKIKDLFVTEKVGKKIQVPTGSWLGYKDLIEDGQTPRITVSGINNGITGYYDCESNNSNLRVYKNFISVSFLGTCFYQENEASLDMKVHCLKPLNVDLNKATGKFLVTVIRQTIQNTPYSDQISSTLLPELSLYLPVDENHNPDWNYMENYITKLEPRVSNSLENLEIARSDTNDKYNISSWREYIIKDLFPNIIKPPVYHTREVKEDMNGIPYVVRSKFNNGIKYRVSKDEMMKPSPSGVISWGAENAAFFYQDEEWISGRDIYYIDTRERSKNQCLFLISCLRQIGRKYPYNYGLFPDLLKEETIYLPVDENNNPDWNYMEKYIEQLKENVSYKIANLT